MSTLRQIEANRRNAQKSTGPTSVTGKAASSMNALKTGIHAKSLVLSTEDPAELDELVEDSYRSFHPTTPEARSLVDEFIYCEWNLRRLRAAETQSWQHQDHTAYSGPSKYPLGYSTTQYANTFSRLQYRMDATRRARERALQSLKQLQAEAAAAPPPQPVRRPGTISRRRRSHSKPLPPKLASFRQPPCQPHTSPRPRSRTAPSHP